MLHSLPDDDSFHEYSSQYYGERWLKAHLLGFCQAGSGSSGEIKKCIGVGLSLDKKDQRKYVHQLSKGCMPGVILAEGGGRCHLPGWSNDTW
ncbi:hypothetical protein GUITHDRAFT_154802 [Guillardia theta CCMP2712]|uniref:Uncharacterized protein n=1 Tax=Guillardia theta (strain CCMP2712) TaxID=905079 RepID=L1IQF4_GUITC|nr:hypothetical protein GUITHDRAFT_154802 [Guillardia theta CCMP2712]EKX38060.1 hypothetical protein GUITHDRAFT_154802 [Guillardia theta CCMP2712]|eukprot:XP_005825040.1 hypothetical protein GUITHDRAFT_154802 [Guillardia theta CCMP2712]